MKRLGDGEISGKTDSGEGTTPLSFTGLQVGASLTDLLMGSQPDQIKLGGKTNSLETADSALFAAILAGDTEFVQRRMNSTGNMGDGAALLMIKTRQKSEEQNFITNLLAHAALTVVEAAKKEDGVRFTQQNAIIANYDLREQRRVDAEQNKKTDIYGGFLEGTALYHDRFGGVYDEYGYTSADGTYTTRTGERANADNSITLTDGTTYFSPAGIAAKLHLQAAVMRNEFRHEIHEHLRKHMPDVPGMDALLGKLAGCEHDSAVTPAAPAASMDSSAPVAITSKMAGMRTAAKAVASVESVEMPKPPGAEAEVAAEGMISKLFTRAKEFAAATMEPGGALSFLRKPGDKPLTAADLDETASVVGSTLKNLTAGKASLTPASKEMMQQIFMNEVMEKIPAELREKFVKSLENDPMSQKRGYAKLARKFLSDADNDGLSDGVEQVAEKAQRAVLETASKIDQEFKEAAAKGPGVAQDVLKYGEPVADTTKPKPAVTLMKGPRTR